MVNQTIHLFNSLNYTSYNIKTLQPLHENEHAKITIATDKLSVGVNIPNFETVVIIDPVDIDNLWKKGGQVGHDKKKVKSPKVIVYILSHKMTALKDLVSNTQGLTDVANNGWQKKSCQQKIKQAELADEGLARVVTAKCSAKAIDEEYDNPAIDPPCSDNCTTYAELR